MELNDICFKTSPFASQRCCLSFRIEGNISKYSFPYKMNVFFSIYHPSFSVALEVLLVLSWGDPSKYSAEHMKTQFNFLFTWTVLVKTCTSWASSIWKKNPDFLWNIFWNSVCCFESRFCDVSGEKLQQPGQVIAFLHVSVCAFFLPRLYLTFDFTSVLTRQLTLASERNGVRTSIEFLNRRKSIGKSCRLNPEDPVLLRSLFLFLLTIVKYNVQNAAGCWFAGLVHSPKSRVMIVVLIFNEILLLWGQISYECCCRDDFSLKNRVALEFELYGGNLLQ